MRIGEVVADRFVVERAVRVGGMGAIFRALDRYEGGPVALKIIRSEVPFTADRLTREATALATLRHPAIVRYIAHGVTAPGELYLAMEWLDGEDLADRLARAPLTPTEALLVVRRAAEALAVAHERGIFHRDLKPSNLFLRDGEPGRVTVLDFGVAQLGGLPRLTGTGTALGTPGYMAPEQARGARPLDATVDVFALGCVLFECVTGVAAFRAEEPVAALARLLFEDPPAPRSVRPDLPSALDDLVLSMLARAPAQRPRDAAAVVAAIEALGEVQGGAAAAPPRGLTPHEQHIASVLVVDGAPLGTLTLAREDARAQAEPANGEGDVVRLHGGDFVQLADGTLLVRIAGSGTANDRAARAARCALALRALLPDRPMALCTGRVERGTRAPVGAAVESAVRLLRAAGERGAGVWLDEATAGLLDGRFVVVTEGGRRELLGMAAAATPARVLLGRPSPFVGRERELAVLLGLLEECIAEPAARVAVVTAPAGAGKTRLLHELMTAIRSRWPAAELWVGGGDAVGAGSPLASIAAALRQSAGIRLNESAGERARQLAARVERHVARADAARVTELLGEVIGARGEDEPPSMALSAARRDPVLMTDQVRRAFTDLLRAETDAGPVVIVLDDLHWSDRPSIELIELSLRLLAERPLFVLAAGREEVHDLFPGLWRERGAQVVPLLQLARKASEKLVRVALGAAEPAVVQQIVERAGGHALYLEEMVRAAAAGNIEQPPETVVAMLQTRLEALDPEARRALRAASVLGRVFWRGAVAELLGAARPEGELDAWLDLLCRDEVIVRHGESRFAHEEELAFRHELLRDAAYAMLTDEDRRLGHRLAALWLGRRGAGDALVMAGHLERAGERDAAIPYLRQAAAQSLEASDFTGALANVERAIDSGAGGETLAALQLLKAQALLWLGDMAGGGDAALAAARGLPRGSAPWYAAQGERAQAATRLGRRDDLVAVAEDVLATPPTGGGAERAEMICLARLIARVMAFSRRDLVSALLARIEELRPRVGDDPLARGWVETARSDEAYVRARPAEGIRAAEAARDAFERAGDLRNAAVQAADLVLPLCQVGALERAAEAAAFGTATAVRLGLRRISGYAMMQTAIARWYARDLEAALPIARAAVEELTAIGDPRMSSAALVVLSNILLARGDVVEAEKAVRTALDLTGPFPGMDARAHAVLAEVLSARGEPAEALAAATTAVERLERARGSFERGEFVVRLVHAETLVAAGDPRAPAVIAATRAALLARADEIDDPIMREGFLHRVHEHARILALAEQIERRDGR